MHAQYFSGIALFARNAHAAGTCDTFAEIRPLHELKVNRFFEWFVPEELAHWERQNTRIHVSTQNSLMRAQKLQDFYPASIAVLPTSESGSARSVKFRIS